MDNHYDLYKNKLRVKDLIETKTIAGPGTETLIEYKVVANLGGYITAWLLRDLSLSYQNFTFDFFVNQENVLVSENFNPVFIPLLGDFMPAMFPIQQNDVIKFSVNDAAGGRTFLIWIKIIVPQVFK